MGEGEEIRQYSPREQEEIDRILNVLPEEKIISLDMREPVPATATMVMEDVLDTGVPEVSDEIGDIEEVEDISDLIEEVEEPEPLDELLSPLDTEALGEAPGEPAFEGISEEEEMPGVEIPEAGELGELEEIPDLGELDDLGGLDDLGEIPPSAELGELEEIPGLSEEEEISPVGEIDELATDELEEMPEFAAEEVDELAEMPEFAVEEIDELAEDRVEPEEAVSEEAEFATTLDELDALTSEEPDSIDLQDITRDRYVEEGEDLAPPAPEMEEIGDIEAEEIPPAVSITDEMETDIPDLSDISLDEVSEIPEARDEDIPEIDLGDITDIGREEAISEIAPALEEEEERAEIPTALEGLEKIEGIEDAVEDFEEEEPFEAPAEIPSIDEIEIPSELPEPEEDRGEAVEAPVGEEEIELSDRDLKKLKKAILLFHANLRKAIREAILEDLLPAQDTQQLVDMILSGKPESNVHRFLEKKLKRTIDISGEEIAPRRRVIAARPEYTREGIERQKRLLKMTRVFGIAALVAFVVTILSYQFMYKPIMARRYINEGVSLIRSSGEPVIKKARDYKKAEDLFQYVEENYARDYLYGYNSYGRAYFDKREFESAFQKLTGAYEIDKNHIDTLNNLGYFFSRVPENYFRRIEGRVQKIFYQKVKPPREEPSQLDIAIDFYRRVLNLKPDNVTALYGIGNTYMFQGQYFKARQYYENILKVDKDSVVGYAGLLNLFIERDDFPEVLSVHSDLRYKEMLPELPSSLLAKLAAYYLGKKKTETTNIRVDYGIQSTKIKDINDNPYPAVRSALDALMEKDPEYPPLYFHHARLARAMGNLKLMEEYLNTAIRKEPGYFAALQLLGEYYYLVKEPVQAYRSFKKAIAVSSSPPEFTYDDFYYETESVGKSYAYIGNIFYYFFDKVKYRFGDELEDEEVDQEIEKLANYKIAREKYEQALEEGYQSPELFYNLGRIYYMKGLYENYEKAIEYWLHLYEDFALRPELMYALGNAFYHINNLEASKGEYLKLISIFEHDADSIKQVVSHKPDHVRIFQTLSLAYNNLGAVYQRQDDEVKSSICFWKAIDYAKRINRENEFARVNLARSFKVYSEKVMPVIDENIPFSIAAYRENVD